MSLNYIPPVMQFHCCFSFLSGDPFPTHIQTLTQTRHV